MAAIKLSTPDVVEPTETKVYDEIWLSHFAVFATNPNGSPTVIAKLDKARTLADGSKELKPDGSVNVHIDDLWTLCVQKPELMQCMYTIVAALKDVAQI
jgi:hypothetical protein